ncbi:MAG TPA: helix-turn-helix domain-containing protein [Ignavibacteriaceae bacterium]|nr:helix-turn-helix domain-containing protein [Ignavibacteriaceae bacterium]
MDIIFLLGAIQAFFFGVLLLDKGTNRLPPRLLLLFFSIIGFVLIEHYLFQRRVIFEYPHLMGLTYTFPIILGPILFFYTKSLINENIPISFRNYSLHSIPFLFIATFLIYDFYFLSPQEKLIYYEKETQGETSGFIYIAEFFINFSIPFYSIVSLLLLQNHLKQIKQSYSNTKNIDLHWLKIVLICMVFVSFVSVLMGLLSDYFNFISFEDGDNLMYITLTVIIYFLGYYGIKQKPILSNNNPISQIETSPTQKPKYATSSLKDGEKEKLTQRLTKSMENEKPYLYENLTLKELADKLETTPNNLSQIINEVFNKNFYEFINEYRINEVKSLLTDPEYSHYSMLGIAFECGFNSKSTFNSVFKQFTGKTPSEYKKTAFDLSE